MTEFLAELIGTYILVFIGLLIVGGIQFIQFKKNTYLWLLMPFGWGIAYAFGIYIVFDYSGAHLNPALTLGLAAIGQFSWNTVPEYLLGQMLGAFFAALMIYLIFFRKWKETQERKKNLSFFVTMPTSDNPGVNLLREILSTFSFVLFFLILDTTSLTKGIFPIFIGMFVAAVGLAIGGKAGIAMNPARDLGSRAAYYLSPIYEKGTMQWRDSWIPFFGTIIGGIYGALFYQRIFLGVANLIFWIGTLILVMIGIWTFIYGKNKRILPET